MLKKFAALLAALTLAFTALFAGALPAQSAPKPTSQVGTMDYGTYVLFTSCGNAANCTGWHMRIWTMNGVHNYLFFGESARNVRDVCPPDHAHALEYFRPNGTGPVHKDLGECQDMEWASTGTYKFSVLDY